MNKAIEVLIKEYIGTGESIIEWEERLELKEEEIGRIKKYINMKKDKQRQIKEFLEDADIDIEDAIVEWES